MITADIQTAM